MHTGMLLKISALIFRKKKTNLFWYEAYQLEYLSYTLSFFLKLWKRISETKSEIIHF